MHVRRFFEDLRIGELEVYITIAPLSDPQRSSSSMLRLATATGLTSVIDLDDVCIRMRPFRLQNRCMSPADVLQKLLADFNEQVPPCCTRLHAVQFSGASSVPVLSTVLDSTTLA